MSNPAQSLHSDDDSEPDELPTDSPTDESNATQPFAALRPQHAEFAKRFYECGDISRAYRAVYPTCTSKASGRQRGRVVLNRPEVAEYLSVLRKQALVPPGLSADNSNADRLAWLAEVRHMAFATPGGRGRISHRDKRESLKLYGEANDWFPKGVTPTGVRAVFNIRIGNQRVVPGGRITIDAATGEPVDLIHSEPSGLPDKVCEQSEQTLLASRLSPPPLESGGGLRADDGHMTAGGGQETPQGTDLHQERVSKPRRAVQFTE